MKFTATTAEITFSLKCFVAAMLALYLAMRIDLQRPFWAMTTAYIVAQPFSGAVRSKAIYRVIGTVLGSAVTIYLVPLLSNSPELLTLALALWVGGCLYIAVLDRTPRSYLFMLSGYTAALIGFPSATNPTMVFDVALARVEEITLGIVCATIIHSLVFPQSVGSALLARLDHALSDAKQWINDALTGQDDAEEVRDQRNLARDITELRIMSTHLPFDTSHLRWMSAAIGRLQDRLAAMVPLLSAIEDRLQALRQMGDNDITLLGSWQALLDKIVIWSRFDSQEVQPKMAQLQQEINELTPVVTPHISWAQVVQINLATRLRTLIDTCYECYQLRQYIGAGVHGALPAEAWHATGVSPYVLHRDHMLALLSGIAAFVCTVGVSAFWIITAWPAGSAAAMMAAVFCAFFASQDDPAPSIQQFLTYTVLSMPISALYLLIVLPAIDNFPMLVMTTAPVFFIFGIFMARPSSTGKAMAMVLGVAGMLSMQETGTADLVSFLNSMLAQLVGIGAAVLATRLLRSVGAEWVANRLLRASWAELARVGAGERVPSIDVLSTRMLDRIALLTPRLAMAGVQQELFDTMGDLRVGLNMAHLSHMRQRLESDHVVLQPLLRELSHYFRHRPEHAAPAPALLNCIDASLRTVCAARPSVEQYDAVAALAGIRRQLFPEAAPYEYASHTARGNDDR